MTPPSQGSSSIYLGVDCTVIIFQALSIVLDPDKDVGVDSSGDVDQDCYCQHHVDEEDNA